MKTFKEKSLQSKMILMNIAIVAMIGAAVSYQVVSFTSKQRDEIHDRFKSLADSTSDAIQAQFYERYGDVQAFAMNPQVHPVSGNEINSTLDAYAALYGIYDLIIITDAQGKIVGINTKDPAGKDIQSKKLIGKSVAGTPWFKNTMAGNFTEDKEKAFLGTYFEDVQMDQLVSEAYGEKRVGTSFSAPIKDVAGTVIGVVSNRAGSRWFESELQNIADNAVAQGFEHPVISVINSSGVLVGEAGISPDGKNYVQRDFNQLTSFNFSEKSPKNFDPIWKNKKLDFFVGEDSRTKAEFVWGYAPATGKKWVDSIGWSVVVGDAADEAYGHIWSIQKNIFLSLGFFFLVASLVGVVFAKNLAQKLREMAQGLANSSAEVNQVAKVLAATSSEMSSSSSEQAAALQETVASIDEVSAMVQKNADNAKRSQEVSVAGSEKARKGKEVVGEMIQSIGEINTSNQEITKQIEESNKKFSEIVKVIQEIGSKTKVINDIVFQTKLLSFNASVEAARAGEHGKGFAVVAEEVGNLAQMSGNAAKEITQMLDSSVAKVEQIVTETRSKVERLTTSGKEKIESGIVTAQKCSVVLDEIVQSVDEINSMVTEIATASNEQAIGVNEINKAMNQLDQVTQANATVTQHTATSADQLKNQNTQMGKIIEDLVHAVEGNAVAQKHGPSTNAQSTVQKGHEPATSAKVLSFPKKEVKKQAAVYAEKKVVGSDIAVPSRDDSRFEEV